MRNKYTQIIYKISPTSNYMIYTSRQTVLFHALAFTNFKIVFKDCPGPHSNVLGKYSPSDRSYRICIVCSHFTGLYICLGNVFLMSSAFLYLFPSMLEWTLIKGLFTLTLFTASRNGSAAGCINSVWKAPDTGSRLVRFNLKCLAFSSINFNPYTKKKTKGQKST